MSQGERFLAWLERLKAQKTWTPARAALRRSLAFPPGTYPKAMPYVEPFVEGEGWKREAHYLAAALYALKDGEHRKERTLARALREKAQDSGSVEKRFLALLEADRDQIAFRLRQAVALVEGGLDFARLLDDLLRWFSPERPVQARWAREFYGAEASEEERKEVEA
ncbi:type I-E CRISPR-associated protein Cse2/CasB [Thermus sp.]|uniref:type I-E CRISPR-associated protein Cse2/CasB n=1 Tax=Thermus sp. TaxID=275 RepID=UPI00322009EF